MPTYYKPGTRKNNEGYTVRGYVSGRQREITTTARNKADAQDAWADFRRATLAKRRQDITPETATFADAVAIYTKARNLSKNDRTFVRRLEERLGNKLLYEISPTLITEIAQEIYPNALPQTVNRQGIRPAAAIMHMAHEKKLCEYMRIKGLKEIDPVRPISYPTETIMLARQTKGALRVLLITLAHQGWRITETLNIRREWHDHENSRVRRWVSKSKKWRWTALDPIVSLFWMRLPERSDGYLFPWRDRHSIYKLLDKLNTDYTPHQSRRGFATALLEADVNLKAIAQAANWEDTKSVLVYADVNLEQSRKTIQRLRGKTRGDRREAS